MIRKPLYTAVSLLSLLSASIALGNTCAPDTGVALQVLGSGGPIADDARASASYVVWVDGRSRVLIDVGGGALLRFAESGARFRDLDFVGLSHFHADHSADFPALLKSGNFAGRERELLVAGPDGSDPFPGLGQFLARLFDKDDGAFAYLAGYLDGTGGLPRISALEIGHAISSEVQLFISPDNQFAISALPVPHGIVPALAFKVRVGDVILVFASDQNGGDKRFVEFAEGASILVMHMPVPEGVTGVGRKLHAPPGVIGEIASHAEVERLVLSHFMERSLRQLEKNTDRVRSEYRGPIEIADDLACYKIENQET